MAARMREVKLTRYIRTRSGQLRAYTQFRMVGGPLDPLTSTVNCGSCQACCYYEVPLEAHESAEGLTVEEREGTRVLQRREDGACVHLGAAGCEVYEKRPAACRVYDCRDFAVTRLLTTNQPHINTAIKRWQVDAGNAPERASAAKLASIARDIAQKGAGAIWASRSAIVAES